MNNIPSTSVPSIRVYDADDSSALFDSGDVFSPDMYNLCNFSEDASFYHCSQSLQSEYLPPNATPHPSADLDDISELSHLNTPSQMFLTGHAYSLPYPSISQENGVLEGLSPSSLGNSIPSPTSSFGSSLSPSSLYDPLAPEDSEPPLSSSPTTPDQPFPWGLNFRSSDSLVPFPNDSILPNPLGPQVGPQRPRSRLSPSRPGPVASKAMLEANGRRRRHPPQFECLDCGQTFTAQFSLRRHTQSHTGERPFACRIPGCTQRFFNSSDCKRHEKSRKRHKDISMQ